MKKRVLFGVLIILFRIPVLSQSENQGGDTFVAQISADEWLPLISEVIVGLCFLVIPFIFWPFIAKNKQLKSYKAFVVIFFLFTIAIGTTYLVDAAFVGSAGSDIRMWSNGITAIIGLIMVWVLIRIAPKLFQEKKPEGLEKLVAERTAALSELNQRLQLEIESRKLAEKEVAKREKRFRALIENISDGIVLNDESSRILYQSPSVTRILGYSFEERHRKPVIEYVHEEDRKTFLKLYEDLAVLPGEPLQFQIRFKHKEGHYIWLEGIVRNLLHDRNVNGYVANFRDISERKESEGKLRQERYLLRTLIDNVPDYIYIKDTQLRHIINNKANVDLIGAASEAETIGKTVMDYFDPAIAQEFMAADRQVLSSGVPVLNQEEKIIGHSMKVRWLLTSKIPLIEHDKIVGLVGISRDITERKEAEILLKELNVSLALQASKLAASNLELERFAYVASHDLQEPLRMVRSFLQLLKKKCEDKLDPQSHQFIDFAVDGSERMKQLITDLLEYSRVGTVPERFEPVDMNVLIQRTLAILHESITTAGATFDIKTLPVVVGVKTQLGQVVQNLIANAIKYRSHHPPKIVIDGVEEPTQWRFSVSDNGMGIDSRFYEKVFVIFQRLNDESERRGTGIGLAICKKIVEGHGGKIWVESEPGAGSTFYFTISKRK
jgi:two-component system CheB/CheR fusion protein